MKTYLEFICHKAAREIIERLDPVEQRLIELLAPHWHAGENVTVLQAMRVAPEVISPSTAHRRIKKLRAKDMLLVVPDEIDTRTKYVRPGPELLMLLGRLSGAMKQACKKEVQ